MEVESGNWKIIISQRFLRDNSNLTKPQIEKGIIEGPWFLPTINSNHWLPGIGTTGHRAMPCGCCINGQTIDIFAKPHDNFYLAFTEFDNSEIARLRGVNVPPVVAVVDMGDEAMLISELVHEAEPLSVRALNFRATDPRVYTPRDFLEVFISSIAKMHSSGIVHNDLHPGNLGHQFSSSHPPEAIFFDFEYANVLKDYDLICKNNGVWHTDIQRQEAERFEREAIGDLGTFTAFLRFRDFPIRKRALLREVDEIYHTYRSESLWFTNGKKFYRQLAGKHDSEYRRLRAIVQTRRSVSGK